MKGLKPVINEFGYCDENCGKEIVSLSFTSYFIPLSLAAVLETRDLHENVCNRKVSRV